MGWFKLWAGFLLLCYAFSTGAQEYPEFRRLPELRGQSFGLENFLMQPFSIASNEEIQRNAPKRREHIIESFGPDYPTDNFDMRKMVPRPTHFSQPSHQTKPVHEDPEGELVPPPPTRRRPPTNNQVHHGRRDYKRPVNQRIQPDRKPLERPSEFQVTVSEDDPPATVVVAPPQQLESHRRRVVKRKRKRPSTPQPELIIQDVQLTDSFGPEDEVKEIRVNLYPDEQDENTSKPEQVNAQSQPWKPIIEPPQEEQDLQKANTEQRLQPIQRRKPNIDTRPEEEFNFQNSYEHTETAQPKKEENRHLQRRKNHGSKRVKDPVAESLAHLAAQPEILRPEDDVGDDNEVTIEKFKKEVSGGHDSNYFKTDPIIHTTETPQESTHRLKTLLKQQNGQLSLSELLQTQNLSLADFLKGNPGALSALGANKINNRVTTEIIETERPKFQPSRPHIPKISQKSRPFSKNGEDQPKPTKKTITNEEPQNDLPKKLDIVEVTSNRPTYNGFIPKNPKTRPPFVKRPDLIPTISPQNIEDEETELIKSARKTTTDIDGLRKESTTEMPLTSSSRSVYRLTTPTKETTIGENRVVPKRFGEYRPKQRIDRRKPTTETAEQAEVTESSETTLKVATEPQYTQSTKNRVRIPFMSVNNPEISVIVSRKVNVTTTEKPKDRLTLNMKDRINLFKRLNQEAKPTTTTEDSYINARQPVTTEASSTSTSTKVAITTTTEIKKLEDKTTTNLEDEGQETTTQTAEVFTESSDEIVELLKTGSNAKRLQRILESRNMTVDELLEKRASISKQPNVTHLFENQTRSQPLSVQSKIVHLNDNFHPVTDRSDVRETTAKATAMKTETPATKEITKDKTKLKTEYVRPQIETNGFDELFVDESMITPIKIAYDDDKRNPKAYDNTQAVDKNSKSRLHLNLSPGSEGKAKHPVPLWNVDDKSIYSSNPYGYPTYDLNKNLAGTKGNTEPNESIIAIVGTKEETNNNLQSHINEILKEQIEVVKEVRNEEKSFIPPAVKSAIIASGVVMGIALIVFVAIFAACGWKQRQFRLRARSSILNDSLNGSGHKVIKRSGTLSPISFKRSGLYKKTIEFEDTDSSISGSSNTSSYLWNTLKHTFQSRNSTLKNRQEKEEKIMERENRSRRNTLSREEDRPRTLSRDELMIGTRDVDIPRRNTLGREDIRRETLNRDRDRESMTLHRDEMRRESTASRNEFSRDDHRRDSSMSRDTLTTARDFPREDTRRSSMFRDDTRRLTSLLRENERCSFKKIDPDRNIIQTSVNFKRGGFNGSSRHFDSCDHFN